MPLRFLRKQSCWGLPCHEAQRLTHRDFPIIQQWYCSFTLSSIFEKVIMLGVWLSRFGGRCLFDFGASNLVGGVFSNRTLAKLNVVPMSYCCVWEVGADKAGKVGASSISEIDPRGL
ncbi:hypothetical protein ACFX19_029435 [Malus domestica]